MTIKHSLASSVVLLLVFCSLALAASAATCPPDLDLDYDVDQDDLNMMLLILAAPPVCGGAGGDGSINSVCPGDFDGNGIVTGVDYNILAAFIPIGYCIPPRATQTFNITGTSTGVKWSWRIIDAGSTVASALNVGPPLAPGGPPEFANAFVASINTSASGAAIAGCQATAGTSGTFTAHCTGPTKKFLFVVGDAAATLSSECLVTSSLGGSGCSFNPTIEDIGPFATAVPALGPLALLFLSGILVAIGTLVERGRRSAARDRSV